MIADRLGATHACMPDALDGWRSAGKTFRFGEHAVFYRSGGRGEPGATLLCIRHHERRARGDSSLQIESICFLNGGLFPESHRPLLIQKLMLTPLGPLLSRGLYFRAFSRSFSKVFGAQTKPSQTEIEQFWRLLTYNHGTREFYRLFHYIPERRARRARWVGALQQGGVPLRLVNGPEDPVSGAHLATRYRELIPNADVTWLPGIGHYPQVEDPDGVLRACAPLWPAA